MIDGILSLCFDQQLRRNERRSFYRKLLSLFVGGVQCKGTKRAANAIMGPAGVVGRRAVLFAGGGDEEDGGGKKGYN